MGYQIKPKLTVASNLPTVENGSMIGTTDSGDLYIDVDGKRVKITDVITGTLSSIMDTVAPLPNKLYFATDTHQLLQACYSNNTLSWVVLNSGSGGGSSGTGDWGTRAVTADNKTSIRAVPNITMDSNNYVRGNGSVDLQMFRNDSSQIASGMSSFLAGRYSSAKGSFSFACGNNNQANAECSTVFGNQNISSGKNSTVFGNHTINKVDGVVCNNNIIDYGNPDFTNVSGHCGFKGIKSPGLYETPIWNLALTDVLIAKIHVIHINGVLHQIQNVVIQYCEFYRNDVEFTGGGTNTFSFHINNGKLYLSSPTNYYELQIGIFYTLASHTGAMDSSGSSSGSGSGSSSSSSSSYYPDIPDTSSSSSQ